MIDIIIEKKYSFVCTKVNKLSRKTLRVVQSSSGFVFLVTIKYNIDIIPHTTCVNPRYTMHSLQFIKECGGLFKIYSKSSVIADTEPYYT